MDFLSNVILDHVRSGRHLLFSSHQLDLVEDLCETITMIDHGRVVLRGEVSQLKKSSPDRYLRVGVAVMDEWITGIGGRVETRDASGSRIRLEPDVSAGAMLDAVRAHVEVADFGVEAPSLSELFRDAAGPIADDHDNVAA